MEQGYFQGLRHTNGFILRVKTEEECRRLQKWPLKAHKVSVRAFNGVGGMIPSLSVIFRYKSFKHRSRLNKGYRR